MSIESDLAYVAGYFDGEGTVCFSRVQRKYPSLRICITSGDVTSLLFVQKVLGGSIRDPGRLGKNRKMWRWSLEGKKAKAALERLLPYLKAKLYPAVVVQRLQYWQQGWSIPEWQRKAREEMAAEVKAFNHRKTI